MGDRMGTRVVAGSNTRHFRIPPGYGLPECADHRRSITAAEPRVDVEPPVNLPREARLTVL